jgi:hypothetical protein
LGAVTLKCEICGKEITGMSQGHAARLLRVHQYVAHLQYETPSDEDKALLNILKTLPNVIVNALKDENKRQVILNVLEGRVKTFKYLNDKPSWTEILEFAEKMGYKKSELISELLQDWFFEVKEM